MGGINTPLLNPVKTRHTSSVSRCCIDIQLSISGRFFWKTMRPDVVQWINKCSQCNKKKMNKPGTKKQPGASESLLQALRSPQTHGGSDRCVSVTGDIWEQTLNVCSLYPARDKIVFRCIFSGDGVNSLLLSWSMWWLRLTFTYI